MVFTSSWVIGPPFSALDSRWSDIYFSVLKAICFFIFDNLADKSTEWKNPIIGRTIICVYLNLKIFFLKALSSPNIFLYE